MMHCLYHDRLYFTAVNLYGFPARSKIVLPCCNSPRGAEMLFRREYFIRGGKFNFEAYSNLLPRGCNGQTCPHYRPGYSPIREISLGEWRKCPGSCITCNNHIRHDHERILSQDELLLYMEDIASTYADASRWNQSMGENPPALLIGASGDLFFSENYRNILSLDLAALGFKDLRLITSLQTWTAGIIEKIHPITKRLVRGIIISMDGATPEMYERVRQGSSWTRLLKGYEAASESFPDATYKLSVTVSTANIYDVLSLPDKVPSLLPKVSVIEYHAVADWTGTQESRDLLLSPGELEYIKDWCARNAHKNGMEIKFLY